MRTIIPVALVWMHLACNGPCEPVPCPPPGFDKNTCTCGPPTRIDGGPQMGALDAGVAPGR